MRGEREQREVFFGPSYAATATPRVQGRQLMIMERAYASL